MRGEERESRGCCRCVASQGGAGRLGMMQAQAVESLEWGGPFPYTLAQGHAGRAGFKAGSILGRPK